MSEIKVDRSGLPEGEHEVYGAADAKFWREEGNVFCDKSSYRNEAITPKSECRPRAHLNAISKCYPEAWRWSDFFRADRKNRGPDWPSWCFLPMGAWHAIVTFGLPKNAHFSKMYDLGKISALGAWRATQGVYRFDPTLFESIIQTPVSGDLPHEILFKLPEWCVYIETPGMDYLGYVMHGFFAHLEWDVNKNRPELRLLIDTAEGLNVLPLHLGPWSLAESLKKMHQESVLNAHAFGLPIDSAFSIEDHAAGVEPLLSLLLYLCSQNAEIGDGILRPSAPSLTKTKRGLRLFSPNKPTIWEVGIRIGSALRAATNINRGDNSPNGVGSSPRAHIRRAHWHGFHTGPKTTAEGNNIPASQRPFTLKWLPPIAVNVDNLENLPTTIRPVSQK